MLFDIGWPELMLIGVIALIVIGPKDLPRAMRIAGYWIRKARGLSRDFQNHIDQMVREAELDEMRDELKKATDFDIEGEFHSTVDPDGTLGESIKPPELPDYFDETAAGEGPQRALAAPDGPIAPELPLPPDAPEPEFVDFEPPALPPDAAGSPRETAPPKP